MCSTVLPCNIPVQDKKLMQPENTIKEHAMYVSASCRDNVAIR